MKISIFHSKAFFSLLVVLAACSGFFNTCSKDSTGTGHDKLTVLMAGEFAAGESAIVTLDGAEIGTVTENNAISKSVDPGIYVIAFTTTKVISTGSYTIVKEADQPFAFTIQCGAATATITADQDYAILDGTSLFEVQHFGGAEFLPGVAKTISGVEPKQNSVFNFFDKSGRLRFSINKTLVYGEDWTLKIPYVK